MNAVFTAGFARADVTPVPAVGYPLGGYGATHLRLSERCLDRHYVNAVALGEGDTAKVVFATVDLGNSNLRLTTEVRAAVKEATGRDDLTVLVGGTHTHSSVDINSSMPIAQEYRKQLTQGVVDAVLGAIKDLKPAKIFYGSAEVGHPGSRLNFCRHYVIAENQYRNVECPNNTIYCGDNFNSIQRADKEHYHFVGHAQDVDPMLQTIHLVREDADDILLVNFQAHAHVTGGAKKHDMSADFPGMLVDRLEELMPGTKCSYLNGASGNINPHSSIREDSLPGLTFGPNRDYRGYASVLAACAMYAVRSEKESDTNDLDLRNFDFPAVYDHSLDDRVEDAKVVRDVFTKEAWSPKVTELIQKFGFTSPYQANAIIGKSEFPQEGTFELHTVRMGDVAIAFSIGEYFDDLGRFIKKNSPAKLTFFKGYSCGTSTYFPSVGSPEGSYERCSTKYVRGTGEKAAQKLVDMLKEMF